MSICPTCKRFLPEERINVCAKCGDEEHSLVARVLRSGGGYEDECFCSWACFFSWLSGAESDYAIVLPVLKFADRRAFWAAATRPPENDPVVE